MTTSINKNVDEKIDDAVHAALGALGLRPVDVAYLAERLNDWLTVHAFPYIKDDSDSEVSG